MPEGLEVQRCNGTGACHQNLLQMTPVNVGVHQQCRPLLPARSTADWYSRRPMARPMQPLSHSSRHNEQHAALVIRYAFCEMCFVHSSPVTLLRSVAKLRRTAGLQRIQDAVGISGAMSCCALRGANISAAAAADWWRLADAA